jgi:hypothetical protein
MMDIDNNFLLNCENDVETESEEEEEEEGAIGTQQSI